MSTISPLRKLLRLLATLMLLGSTTPLLLQASNTTGHFYTVIEAEEMTLHGDWRVAQHNEGHCPAYPQFWSAGRLRGGAGAEAATATAGIVVPSNGLYAVWVRYESPYGFDTLFDVTIKQQRREVYRETFGDRNDLKSFYGRWRVQEAWAYHNADFVCQKGLARLSQGKAEVILSKGAPGKAGAVRMIDLIAITDDLEREQGLRQKPRPWQPATMVDHCKRPFYLRLQTSNEGATKAGFTYQLFSPPIGFSFKAAVLLDPEQQTLQPHIIPFYSKGFRLPKGVEQAELPAGYDSGWLRFDLSTVATADFNLFTDRPLTFSIARHPDGKGQRSFQIEPAEAPLAAERLLVATGYSFIEEPLLGDEWVLSQRAVSLRQLEALSRYEVPGKSPLNFRIQVSGNTDMVGPSVELIKQVIGRNTAGYEPELYTPAAVATNNINTVAGGYYFPLHNALLKRECYEGDYSRFREALERFVKRCQEDGIGELPWLMKLIEESGPPPLATLREWPVIAERFRDWLKERNENPLELLAAPQLARAIADGTTSAAALWPQVMLSDGSIAAAAENAQLFYLSKLFASQLFIDNLANGVKLIEELLPKGSAGDLGCAWTQDGHGVRRNWYDEMELFRRRGATAFGTENSWGLCGIAHYIGPQTESYQGALARACAKYHPDTRLDSTTAIFSWHLYGYPTDYAETVAYAMAANGIRGVCFATCGSWATTPQMLAWKRAAHTIGAVDEQLFPAQNVKARVALGWNETTAIWDQAIPSDSGFNRPGNVMYQLERHYLYLLLRHMQLPVDLLSDADIEEGRLDDYEVYCMVGSHTTRQAAAKLRDWVAAGGVLLSGAGGGLFDEFNRPLDTLTEVYGVKGQRQYASDQGVAYIPGQIYADGTGDNRLERLMQAPRAKLELIHAHPDDSITLPGFATAALPVLAARHSFTPGEGGAVGTFKDGKTAAVTNSFGKGKALIIGFLPGVSYFYRAFPNLPYGRGGEDLSMHLYPQCQPLVRDALTGLLRSVWPTMGAAVVASHPLVEANLLRDGDKYYIALVNFSGAPLAEVELKVDRSATGAPATARAAFSKLQARPQDEQLLLTVPLDRFEWIELVRGNGL